MHHSDWTSLDPSKADYALKLHWADLHIDALDQSIEDWLNGDAYALVEKLDPQTVHHVLYAQIRKPVEPWWALMVGDVVHSLRSALDHLAFGLLATAHAGTVPAGFERVSEFPLVGPISERSGKAGLTLTGTSIPSPGTSSLDSR